jgi:hypothetical protein|tara:strand:+ start:12838 stop:13362 length:525 start_codon:yes stop_codon:yes gene_type:complete
MNNFNFSDCRKAVNQATFRPTAERKALAIKLLQEALDAVTSLEEVKEKPSKKAKTKRRRRKTTKKATPQQRVADSQEKAFHGKADGVVTPSKKGAKTASVEEAQASLKEMDEKNAAKKAAKLKAKRAASGVSEADRVASLEAKIESLTQVLALHMESTTLPSPANEVSIDELPF